MHTDRRWIHADKFIKKSETEEGKQREKVKWLIHKK